MSSSTDRTVSLLTAFTFGVALGMFLPERPLSRLVGALRSTEKEELPYIRSDVWYDREDMR